MRLSLHYLGSILVFMLLATNLFAKEIPLKADQAFAPNIRFKTNQQLVIEWRIAPNYFLYADQVKIKFPDASLQLKNKPTTIAHLDERKHTLDTYQGLIRFKYQVLQSDKKIIPITLSYQGCSAHGFCYPPTKKSYELDPTASAVYQLAPEGRIRLADTGWQSWWQLLSDYNGVNQVLIKTHFLSMLLIFAGLGLLLSFTPCILPMIPILTSIIVGEGKKLKSHQAFLLSLTYVVGSACTYAIAGVIAALMGRSLQVALQTPLVIFMTVALFILLALSLFGLYDLKLPKRLHLQLTHTSNRLSGGRYLGVFLMGIISALIVSPCVTAPLVGVLIYISHTHNVFFGGSALFALGIGMGVPLLIIGFSAGRFLPKTGMWMEMVRRMFAWLMLAMAIWLSARVLMPYVIEMLWSLYFISFALFFAYRVRRLRKHRKLMIVGGAIFVALSAIIFWENTNLPLGQVKTGSGLHVIHSIADLKSNFDTARASRKPVIIDFYANWCESCVHLDKTIFADQEVKDALSQFTLLRADLSANNEADSQLLNDLQVIAPPTILFFDWQGKELKRYRLVGEISKQQLLNQLKNMREQLRA